MLPVRAAAATTGVGRAAPSPRPPRPPPPLPPPPGPSPPAVVGGLATFDDQYQTPTPAATSSSTPTIHGQLRLRGAGSFGTSAGGGRVGVSFEVIESAAIVESA